MRVSAPRELAHARAIELRKRARDLPLDDIASNAQRRVSQTTKPFAEAACTLPAQTPQHPQRAAQCVELGPVRKRLRHSCTEAASRTVGGSVTEAGPRLHA